jgi:hypothetical protein
MTKREGFNEAMTEIIRMEEDFYEKHWRKTIAEEIAQYKSANEHPRWITVEDAIKIIKKEK